MLIKYGFLLKITAFNMYIIHFDWSSIASVYWEILYNNIYNISYLSMQQANERAKNIQERLLKIPKNYLNGHRIYDNKE